MKNLFLILFIFITCATSIASTPEQRTIDSELCPEVKSIMVIYLDAMEIAVEYEDYCRAYEYTCRAIFWAKATEEQCFVLNKNTLSTSIKNLEEYKSDLGNQCGVINLKRSKK